MSIEIASAEDAEQLEKIISADFPYKMLTREKISERMKRPGTTVFKSTVEGRVIGFAEVEIRGSGGMFMAISVLPEERGKGRARELLESAMAHMASHGVKKAFLLVKKTNKRAKKIYANAGFSFTKMHEKDIEGEKIEVWEKELAGNPHEVRGFN